ncbi:MAG TPA: ABC transporter permease [Candidatus Acidoferrales bacterium]|nr:ABC transporter permease [Candidatus Acidoferrales bacterium]
MKLLSSIRSFVSALFHRSRFDREMDAELRAHIEDRTKDLESAGLPHAEAVRRANLEFGGYQKFREECREALGAHFVDTLVQDVRYALRVLRKSPGFTSVAVLTLALAIGANTALFSVIDAIALRSLPVPDPQQLVLLQWKARSGPNTNHSYFYGGCPGGTRETAAGSSGCSFSYPMFERLRAERSVFLGIFAFATRPEDVSINGSASQLNGAFVSGEFFPTLQARASLGRLIDPLDDAPGAQPVIVLGYAYWRDRLGADPDVIGKTAIVNRVPVHIVGVAQPGFQLDPGIPMDFWLPLAAQPAIDPVLPRQTAANSLWLFLMARLKPGVKPVQAAAAVDAAFVPGTTTDGNAIFKPADTPRIVLLNAADGLSSLRDEFSARLFVLIVAVVLVLSIACANVAGLMLAKSSARQKEMALRKTLGATRWRMIRQLLTESVLLSAAGGALGILLAQAGAKALTAFVSANWYSPLQIDVAVDWHVLSFTLIASVLVGILFGLAPALRTSRVDVTPSLKEGGSQWATDRRSLLVNKTLVFAQVAISIVVLDGAALLVRTLVNLENVKVGFETRNVLIFNVDMTLSGYKAFGDPRSYRAETQIRDRLASTPGVISASYSALPLLSGGNLNTMFTPPGGSRSERFTVDELPVGPKFFETMRIPLIVGRAFTNADFESSAKPEPLIVNQAFARKLFGSQNPLGREVSDDESDKSKWRVIGIVTNTKYTSMWNGTRPIVYTLYKENGAEFEVRTSKDPRPLIPLVQSAVHQVDSNFLVSDVKTQLEQVTQSLFQERLIAGLSSLFGLLAMILVCVGLYGLVAYSVVRRTHEIGVRAALGARPAQILQLVVRQGLLPTLAGIAVGLGVAAGAARYLRAMLFEVRPVDLPTLIAIAILLGAVASLASYIPARRATRVDPMVALRHE